MQLLHRGVQPSNSSALFLPMIDLSSSDTTCIYSTLNYIAQHAKQHDIPTIITFYQPLWWKALPIILLEPDGSPMRRIVLRLGAFHMEMSFLGSIGHIMTGSGLQELLELIYTPNAVDHIITGKSVSSRISYWMLCWTHSSCLILLEEHKAEDTHMALFRVRDGFISAQVSEIFHEPLGTISDVLWTFKRFHNFIFHQSARWVYLGPGVKVGVCFGVRELQRLTSSGWRANAWLGRR